jgi:hypothetical protein
MVEIVIEIAFRIAIIVAGCLILLAVSRGRSKFEEKPALVQVVGLLFFLAIGAIVYFAFPGLRR